MTFLRIVLIPFFPVLYLLGESMEIPASAVSILLFLLLSICQISDVLDGRFARKRNEVTDLGKILDPMADSMLSLTVLFTFTIGPVSLPIFLVFVFLYREFAISALRILCALKGYALAARLSGKIKTVLQSFVFFFIVLLMIMHSFNLVTTSTLHWAAVYSVGIAAVYTVVSACEYFIANRKFIYSSLDSNGK